MRFCGKIGFLITKEDPNDPGVYVPQIVEKKYFGDVLRKSVQWNRSDSLNDDLVVNKSISVVADKFLYDNIGAMKYVEYMGVKWTITSMEPERPRITLEVGGVYNGES